MRKLKKISANIDRQSGEQLYRPSVCNCLCDI